jgi:pimeloyl-ACP methyl ester carboxylesterase
MERVSFELSGGTFHALVAGTGRPLVFLHGFPDHPPTAMPLFAELAARGHRVIAPWLRGYAPSPLRGPFDLERLVADVVELIDRIGGPVDLVGHDWGAAITYATCATAPAQVLRAVTLALPHPLTFVRSLGTSAQARRSWYMALFQLPGAGALAAARDLALIDFLWRRWSPGFTLAPDARAELHACLAASLPAPLAYYRAALRPLGAARDRIRRAAAPITTPLLQLHGALDGCVLPPTEADHRRFAHRVLEIVPHAGHFLHLEQPALIANRIARWLASM